MRRKHQWLYLCKIKGISEQRRWSETEGYYITLKELILKKDNNSKCVYTNIRAAKYVRQKLIGLREEINKTTVIIGDFNTPLLKFDRTTIFKLRIYSNSTPPSPAGIWFVEHSTHQQHNTHFFQVLTEHIPR